MKALPFFAQTGSARWRDNGGALLTLLVFAGFFAWAIRGYFFTEAAVNLSFPLQDGWYCVGQGGNSTLLNYHNSSASQQYALDVVELNTTGARAAGIYPTVLERYEIFGETIYSPCDGRVIAAVDGLPDQIPPAADREHVAGNRIAVACQGVTVLMAHMQNGSLMVEEGDNLTTGQPLGRVGNSGNTSEPHLHIHAVREGSGDVLDGDGVPILFEGVFPVRNTSF